MPTPVTADEVNVWLASTGEFEVIHAGNVLQGQRGHMQAGPPMLPGYVSFQIERLSGRLAATTNFYLRVGTAVSPEPIELDKRFLMTACLASIGNSYHRPLDDTVTMEKVVLSVHVASLQRIDESAKVPEVCLCDIWAGCTCGVFQREMAQKVG
jgi:hypothetical protein